MTITMHAERILAAQDFSAIGDAYKDVKKAMEKHWHLTVESAESLTRRGHGGWCDGMSLSKSKIVLYRPTGNRRQNFTLAHELGHHLVENDEHCYNWLADRENPDRELEQICDVIAARILIPTHVLDDLLAGSPPTAASLSELYHSTRASWSACAVALASRLRCDGFVAIINGTDHQVIFAARARDTYPYAWAGDSVPLAHELRRPDPPRQTKSWWPRFNVNEPRTYYLSTEVAGDFIHAVFAENDLWGVEKLHLPSVDQEDRRHDGLINCPSCGYKGRTAMFPCSTCRTPTCQKCGECECDRRNRQKVERCTNCTVSFLPHLIEDGLCPNCR